MSYLVNNGLALYWGTSEWSATQIMEAYHIARLEHLVPPTMEQPEYSMLERNRVEKEYQTLYSKIGLGTTIWSPLKYGILSGKYLDGTPKDSRLAHGTQGKQRIIDSLTPSTLEKVKKLKGIADDLGCTLAQLALAWTLRHPDVSTAITGASNQSQVIENIKSLKIIPKLKTKEVDDKIESILQNQPNRDKDPRG